MRRSRCAHPFTLGFCLRIDGGGWAGFLQVGRKGGGNLGGEFLWELMLKVCVYGVMILEAMSVMLNTLPSLFGLYSTVISCYRIIPIAHRDYTLTQVDGKILLSNLEGFELCLRYQLLPVEAFRQPNGIDPTEQATRPT